MITATGAVFAVFGPTGVGKTAVAVKLAQALGIRVISCDSMQIYSGFPVLTNQPTVEESAAVPHALVGVVDPARSFSAAEYAERARPLLERELETTGHALLVGGTGLYMRAALAPLAVAAAADPTLRQQLEARARAEGLDALYSELASIDPVAADSIDPRNARRVIRALEAVTLSGRVWSGRADLWSPDYYHPTVLVGLVLERQELYRRIDTRAARIVEGGAVDEVMRFRRERGVEATAPGGAGIRSAIGYPEICRLLAGEQTREQTIEQIAAATRKYARRQLTWLRKLEGAVMIDVGDREPGDVARDIARLHPAGQATRRTSQGEAGQVAGAGQ